MLSLPASGVGRLNLVHLPVCLILGRQFGLPQGNEVEHLQIVSRVVFLIRVTLGCHNAILSSWTAAFPIHSFRNTSTIDPSLSPIRIGRLHQGPWEYAGHETCIQRSLLHGWYLLDIFGLSNIMVSHKVYWTWLRTSHIPTVLLEHLNETTSAEGSIFTDTSWIRYPCFNFEEDCHIPSLIAA